MAPRRLASTLQSLPPILHIKDQCSVSSYSKGSRGLSVLPRVHCIFTASSISLSLGWRQPGHHYAIRAGRNLPDKEFRYLRTGQASVHIQRLAPSQAPVFLVNSRYPLVCATPKSSHSKCVHHRGSPLNRRNGSDLPSSLTRIRSIALVFST